MIEKRGMPMPGFTTHYILGMKICNNMPQNNLKFIIAKYRWFYQLGLQEPDMFFYNLPILCHHDHRNVCPYIYEHHVDDFFRCCLLQFSRIDSRQQREEGLTYMCGFIRHYIGDSICHPYVYGRIEYDVYHPGSYYHGLHAKLENNIDALLLQKYKRKKPSQFNQVATICLSGMETQFTSRFLSDCINEALHPLSYKNRYQMTAPVIHRSILTLRFGYRTLSDPNSHKKDKIEFFESVFLKNPVASSKLVTDIVENLAWSLNLHHKTWCNPWDKRIASKSSFPNLFEQSLGELSTVSCMVNSMLDTGQPLRTSILEMLLSELEDYSYHSGLPCVDN